MPREHCSTEGPSASRVAQQRILRLPTLSVAQPPRRRTRSALSPAGPHAPLVGALDAGDAWQRSCGDASGSPLPKAVGTKGSWLLGGEGPRTRPTFAFRERLAASGGTEPGIDGLIPPAGRAALGRDAGHEGKDDQWPVPASPSASTRLEQQKARLQLEEGRLRDAERKARTRRLIEAGGLLDKAGLLALDANALYGALLSLRDGAADPATLSAGARPAAAPSTARPGPATKARSR